MELYWEVQRSLDLARSFVSEGVEQILQGNIDEAHGVSSSPGATALAALALLAVGRGYELPQKKGIQWLEQHHKDGWGKYPGDKMDEEITQIVEMVLVGSKGGWKAKLRLLSQVQRFSPVILSLGDKVVPGLEGPKPEEILLPTILEDRILAKLPLYGRPVVVAASVLDSNSQDGIQKGLQYLLKTQMSDGSWAEDIIATSMAILALMTKGVHAEQCQKAAQWLVQKQYRSGGWPAFDQLKVWAVGWALRIFSETSQKPSDIKWLKKAIDWLKMGQNEDGSFGSTPPYTHPDLDDTSVALIGLHQVLLKENQLGVYLLKRLQNNDGSWGTFPSFQGIPPKVSSEFPVYIPSVDVSIHVLEALRHSPRSQEDIIQRGLYWILAQQDHQGAFPGTWFEGTVYSTAQALELLSKLKPRWERWSTAGNVLLAKKKGQGFLLNAQRSDGGWGSVVDTSLAVSGLSEYSNTISKKVFDQGIRNILAAQKSNGSFDPSYQGVYAKGWNYEEPLSSALTTIRALQRFQTLKKGSFLKFFR